MKYFPISKKTMLNLYVQSRWIIKISMVTSFDEIGTVAVEFNCKIKKSYPENAYAAPGEKD